MPRQRRIWFPGAIYHITCCGNCKEALFYDETDFLRYLSILESVRYQYPFYLHSYCLMTNHIHLLVETTHAHIKDIMKMLNFHYALHFNKRHNFIGHVFQDRYHSDLIDSAKYFLQASKYIHLNPKKASIVEQPANYRWSSYKSFISSNTNDHVVTSRVLSYFPEPQFEHYRKFVEAKEEEATILLSCFKVPGDSPKKEVII